MTHRVDKIRNIRTENPSYWTARLEASRYSEIEILETLKNINSVNADLVEMTDKIWAEKLTDEFGVMGGFDGYASETHRQLALALGELGSIEPQDNQNGQYEWPVRTWQKEVKKLQRQMKKVRQMADLI